MKNRLFYQPSAPVAMIYWSLTLTTILAGCIWEMESASFQFWPLLLWVPGVLLAVYGILGNTVTLIDPNTILIHRIFWLKPKQAQFVNIVTVLTTKRGRTLQYRHPHYLQLDFLFRKSDRQTFDQWTATINHVAQSTEGNDPSAI